MIKHNYKSRIPFIFQARAVTFGRHIFYIEENPPTWLIKHELEHVKQYQKYGFFGFLYRYLKDYFKGRLKGLGHWEAYYQIPFEKEAQKAERI